MDELEFRFPISQLSLLLKVQVHPLASQCTAKSTSKLPATDRMLLLSQISVRILIFIAQGCSLTGNMCRCPESRFGAEVCEEHCILCVTLGGNRRTFKNQEADRLAPGARIFVCRRFINADQSN
jgi:hypothetical protein